MKFTQTILTALFALFLQLTGIAAHLEHGNGVATAATLSTGAMTLIAAHSALEDVVLTKDEARLKRPLEQRWTEIVYEGRWFSPAREAIDAFVDSTQELVTGEVRVELRPNAAVVTGRRSPHMLYAAELASYGTGETFPHDAAEGFIRISSLETELHAARARAASRA